MHNPIYDRSFCFGSIGDCAGSVGSGVVYGTTVYVYIIDTSFECDLNTGDVDGLICDVSSFLKNRRLLRLGVLGES